MLLTNFFNRIRHDQAGATAVEYGLIVSLIVIACIAAFSAFAASSDAMWTTVATLFDQAANGGV